MTVSYHGPTVPIVYVSYEQLLILKQKIEKAIEKNILNTRTTKDS